MTRGRPRLDPAGASHSPRVAVRLPDRIRVQLARRAAEEGRSVSESVRAAVERWASELSAVERADLRRIVRLSDRERESLFLTSNANVERLLKPRST
jgi:CopG antitoxin of type II toxin-antitoxin system